MSQQPDQSNPVQAEQQAQALKARFPYQFQSPAFPISTTVGWLPRFSRLCEQVDDALGEDKRGFHWSGCGEKFGVAQFRFDFHRGSKKFAVDLRARLNPIVDKALADLKAACAVCGQPGEIARGQLYMLTLCEKHRHQHESFWLVLEEGEHGKKMLDEIATRGN